MVVINATCVSWIESDAMLDNAVLVENQVEHLERPPAFDHEIFRDNLEPADDRRPMPVASSTPPVNREALMVRIGWVKNGKPREG